MTMAQLNTQHFVILRDDFATTDDVRADAALSAMARMDLTFNAD